jgi:hypothetical protein
MATTKHNHDALPFGRRLSVGQCPRCDELHSGAPARKGWGVRARYEAGQLAAIKTHDCKAHGCGPVCVFGDW